MKRLAVVAIAFGMLGSGGGVAAAFNGSPPGMEIDDRKGRDHGKKCTHDRGDRKDKCRGGHDHDHDHDHGGLLDLIVDIL